MSKKEVIEKILHLMDESGVSVAEISTALKARVMPKEEERFDLLCKVGDELKRVSYEEGRDMNPIAIFPRNKFKFYLFLEETGMVPFPPIEEKDKLPDDDLSTLIQEVRSELNEKLMELGKAPVRGDYWLNGHELSGIGYWMARFHDDRFNSGYYDSKRKAKVRYIGRL